MVVAAAVVVAHAAASVLLRVALFCLVLGRARVEVEVRMKGEIEMGMRFPPFARS